MLEANLAPPRPWKLKTEIPIFALALVEGTAEDRRWLVYAHSPLQSRRDAEVTIPEYGKITVDVPVGGSFTVVDEKQKSTRRAS